MSVRRKRDAELSTDHPLVSEDIEKEWSLFRSAIIASVVECCGQKRLRVAEDSEKRTLWWNQDVKEAIRAKKDAFKASSVGDGDGKKN